MYNLNISRMLYRKDRAFLPLYGSTSRRNLSLGWNAPLLLTGKEPWPCTDGNLRIDICDRIIQIRFLTPSWFIEILLWWWFGFCRTIRVLVENLSHWIIFVIVMLSAKQNFGIISPFANKFIFRFARRMSVSKVFFIFSWN